MTCHQHLVTPPWLVSTSLVLRLDESLAQFTSRRQHLYGELSWGTNNTNSTTILTVYCKQFIVVVPRTIHHHPEMRPSMWQYMAAKFKAAKKWVRTLVRAVLWFSVVDRAERSMASWQRSLTSRFTEFVKWGWWLDKTHASVRNYMIWNLQVSQLMKIFCVLISFTISVGISKNYFVFLNNIVGCLQNLWVFSKKFFTNLSENT